MQAKAQPKAQLGESYSQSDEPRRGSVVASHTHIVCFAFHTQASCRRRRRIVVNSMQAKSKPEAQLGDRRSQSDEPRRVGCGKSFRLHTGERQRFLRSSFSLLPIAAVFFRRSRLFIRFHPSKAIPQIPTSSPVGFISFCATKAGIHCRHK